MTASIYDLSLPELTSLLESWGEPAYRALQIWQGLYQHFWNDPAHFLTLPASLRIKLSETLSFEVFTPATILQSSDKQTIKTLFKLPDALSHRSSLDEI